MRASRSVFAKHVALQSQNLSAYRKTSSLVKAINFQADRFPRASQLASALLNRTGKLKSSYSTEPKTPRTDDVSVPNTTSSGVKESSVLESGKDQDHFYERPKDESASESGLKRDIVFKQVRAKGKSLPEGTILPQDSKAFKLERESDGDEFTAEQSSAPAQEPLEETGNNDDLEPKSSSRSSIPLPAQDDKIRKSKDARVSQRIAEFQIPNETTGSSPRDSVQPRADDHSSSRITVSQDQDAYYSPPADAAPSLSSLPRTKIPKATETSQGSDDHVRDERLNQEVYYSPDSDNNAAAPTSSLSEGQYSELFRSLRVTRELQKESSSHISKDTASKGEPDHDSSAEVSSGDDLSRRGSETDTRTDGSAHPQGHRYEQRSTTSTRKDAQLDSRNAQEVSKVDPECVAIL